MFITDFRHWSTVAEFVAYLSEYDPFDWVRGLTLHHTIIPTASQWHGVETMNGLVTFYSRKGWTTGPHLFLCIGATRKTDDGIWQFTPLDIPGTHAGVCNEDHHGIEICGNFDKRGWPPALKDLVYGTSQALLEWGHLGVTASSVTGHRECLPNKTCPGSAIKMDEVRQDLQIRMAVTPILEPVTVQSEVMSSPRISQSQAEAGFAHNPSQYYTSADLTLVIIPTYFKTCAEVGLDPSIALSQMVYETRVAGVPGWMNSFWVRRDGKNPSVGYRNPAGIGVDGSASQLPPTQSPTGKNWAYNTDRNRWERGLSFESWATQSIPAHVGRLVAYYTKEEDRTPAQQRLVEIALEYRSLPQRLIGSCTILDDLNGKWNAGSTTYTPGIAEIARLFQSMPR